MDISSHPGQLETGAQSQFCAWRCAAVRRVGDAHFQALISPSAFSVLHSPTHVTATHWLTHLNRMTTTFVSIILLYRKEQRHLVQ